MQKLKQTILGLSLILFAALNVAQAKTVKLGTISPDQTYTVTNVVGAAPKPWMDFVTFSLDESSYLNTAILSFSFATSGSLDNFLLDLVNVDTQTSLFTSNPLGQVESFMLGLDAGNYQFNLSGSGSSNHSPGIYTLAVSPVPEASLYSMMITGLAFLGLALRRRKSK